MERPAPGLEVLEEESVLEISAAKVKELRDKTNAGMMDCKKALKETNGDLEKAIVYLREKGLAVARKRADRVASEGVVQAYIHTGGKLGVMLEVNCETDFVAKTPEFNEFAKNLAMQVAAANPLAIGREDLDAEVIAKEKAILLAQARESGKPENILEKMVEGRLNKFYSETCLLEQPYVKNPDIQVQDYLNEMRAKTGENVIIRRFIRYQLGAA
ncbi:translation elongation factor Ts [Desulfobacca acetoxidans]|uniref:Elongation factor Ts n=1 Tax=Desulfobacca acetoxidans (strain ATCC 700848 / DSM 11109 / ASRB2) TaxID=880072 RepID=F2NEA2_DESAR|nr:translation elongation factor Ts [Desulfobacca acetoxidans]AEB10732.1 Elongation factor Ts [Desulfobacca acetoxidans DSM 11109]HAY21823.1 translation elongation factor Ts [Desulfobacterales bacterium]